MQHRRNHPEPGPINRRELSAVGSSVSEIGLSQNDGYRIIDATLCDRPSGELFCYHHIVPSPSGQARGSGNQSLPGSGGGEGGPGSTILTGCKKARKRTKNGGLFLRLFVPFCGQNGSSQPAYIFTDSETESGHEDTEAIRAHQHLPCSVASGLASVPSVSKGLVPLVAALEPR